MDVKFIVCCVLLSLCRVQLHGQITYNYYSELCCNGVVKPQVKMGTDCCGDATYQPYIYGEDIYSDRQPYETCCSGKVYKYNKSQMCCGGQMQTMVGPLEDNICCGDKVYHNPDSTLICCDGQAMPKDGKLYSSQCCGNKIYKIADPRVICCNNVLHDVSCSFTQCCGNVTYDVTKQSCCNETILNEPFIDCYDYSCAGRNLQGSELCCEGVVFNVSRAAALRGISSCCGSTIVQNPSKEICCWKKGVVVEGSLSYQGCCGTTAYNYNTHTCCGSTLYPNPENQQLLCCGSQAYDGNKQVCCNGVVITVENAPQIYCCGADSLYLSS